MEVRCGGSHPGLRSMFALYALSRLYPKNREMPGLRETNPTDVKKMQEVRGQDSPSSGTESEDRLARNGSLDREGRGGRILCGRKGTGMFRQRHSKKAQEGGLLPAGSDNYDFAVAGTQR